MNEHTNKIISLEYFFTLRTLFQAFPNETIPALKDTTPQELLTHITIRTETLMRLYYLRHSFQTYDPFMCYSLALLGNFTLEILSTTNDTTPKTKQALLSTLVLCAIGLSTQSIHYPLAALVNLALTTRTTPEHLQFLNTFIAPGTTKPDYNKIVRSSRCRWPLPIIHINEDPENARLQRLIKDYDQLTLDASSSEAEVGGSRVGSEEVL